MRTFLKSLSAILFWLAALIYFATAYDMSIYAISVLQNKLQISEIIFTIHL